MGILRTEMSDGAFESYWWVHSKSDPKKIFCMWITRKSEGEWRHRGDVGSAYTPQKTVLRHWEFCCSYRDKRWRVGKPVVSRTQIWPQKNFFSSGFGDKWGWSDVTTGSKPYHHTRFECFDNIYHAVAYSETSDCAERWRVGKLIMSRAQIWP